MAASRLRQWFVSRFLNFGSASNFPFEIPFKKCFKIVFFFRFGVELQFPTPLRVVLLFFSIQCLRPRATVRSTRAKAMAIRPCDFLRFTIDFELLDLHALSNVSAWALLRQLRMLMCCRALTLETCCNAKSKRKEIWSRKTWWLTLASKKWQLSSTVWRLHCMSTMRCKIHGASRADEVSQQRSAGILAWVTSNMDSALFVSKPWQLFARNKTIPWQNITALPWQMRVCTLRRPCWMLVE